MTWLSSAWTVSVMRHPRTERERERENPLSCLFQKHKLTETPHGWSCGLSFLRWPWQGYIPFVRDFSRSSMQRWRMGLGAGNHSVHTLLFCFLLCVFWAPQKCLVYSLSPFKWAIWGRGHVKVSAWVMNQNDNSFPLVELVANLGQSLLQSITAGDSEQISQWKRRPISSATVLNSRIICRLTSAPKASQTQDGCLDKCGKLRGMSAWKKSYR